MSWFSAPRKRTDLSRTIFGRQLDADLTLYPLGEGRATEAQVSAIGKNLGVRFPDAFVAHVTGEFPGAIVMAAERVWPRPKAFDVAPFWKFLYGVHSYTPLTSSEDWMRLDLAGQQFQTQTGHVAVPILKLLGDANLYCVDRDGSIMEFDHELNALSRVELDFWTLFEREIRALVERKNRLLAEAEGDA